MTAGTILYDTYVIQEVLGEGGFGITYRGIGKSTGETVAIKEYFPFQFAARQKDSCNVVVPESQLSEYIHGKERFIKEASILKEYQYLQGIVKVWDCFETNNTAYIIMEYIDGITLKEYVASHGRMHYAELMDMILPVLKSLISLHKHDVIHRDISPDNMMIGLDNCLYLIDFGAAKAAEQGKTTTVLLKAGYAPPEQYLHDGDLGAWTDVYALCATIYMALCGKVPTDAVARLQGKELIPLSDYGVKLESWQWKAISKGMSMRAAERFRDMEQLYDALTIEPSDEDIKTVVGQELEPLFQQKMQELNENEPVAVSQEKNHNIKGRGRIMLFLFIAIAAAFYGGRFLVNQENGEQQSGAESLKRTAAEVQETTADMAKQEEQLSEESQVKLCSMPDVTGLLEDAAIKKITAIDKEIKVHITRIYSSDAAVNVVIEQSVKADTQYNEGTIKEITLTVSDGAEPSTQVTTKTSTAKQQKTEADYFDVEPEDDEMVEFYLD